MLVLTRKPGEEIVIDGTITIRVIRMKGNAVQVGITAPRDVPIARSELCHEADEAERFSEGDFREQEKA